MRGRVKAAGLVSLGFAALLGGAMTLPVAASGPAKAAGDYIVILADESDASATASEHARSHGAKVGHVYRYALRGYSAHLSATAATRIAADRRVAKVEPDGVVTTTGHSLPTGTNRVDAELSPTARIDDVATEVNVDVAVLDTGADLKHPELNILKRGTRNCSTGRGADDGHGHGTHVSGIIGAQDDGVGVVGVAPGARIWPIRVLDANGSGSFSDVICGIDYVTANASRIEVANMSLGGSGSDGVCGINADAMHEAICASVARGVTYVVAAGNSGADANQIVPAAYDEVITVSALADFDGLPGGVGGATCRYDVDDTFADFSNYGADVDLVAPGVCIRSTWRGGGYNTISGTSMASPHVAAGAALYKVTHPNASPAMVKAALQAAGSTDWNNADDRDGIKEKLLNVATF
ncbi:MAG TPA: S8 family serine peptidase [Micromonosporaceae bacterium]